MSLSEKLIIAAKNGSTREVRKLLGRGALFTKDQVSMDEVMVYYASMHGSLHVQCEMLHAIVREVLARLRSAIARFIAH